MAGKGDIVEQALKLVMGGAEKAAPKVVGTDAAGRPMLDFRGAVVSHFTDPESAADIWSHGYRQVGDGYYGRAVSFTPNREYGRQFGGVETNAIVSPEAKILDSGNPEHSEIIQRVLNDRTLAPTNPRPGQKTWDQKFRELGYDGLYDPGAGDLFIYNPAKVKPLPPERAFGGRIAKDNGGEVDPYAEEIASAKRLLEESAYDDQSWSDWAGDVAGNAVRTARSILPTALGGEGKVGISDIARGAYEAGKDAVTFPGDVITGKQALFDEAGRPLESAVARSFNTASTIGGASSAIPVPDNSLRVFGGIKSLTADKNAIRDAMKMESKGATPDEIWDNTGWFRGADGRWRYEIPDIGTTVNSAALQLDLSRPTIPSVKTAKLGDYLQHPKFFAAYPQFKDMNVRTMPDTSSYGGMYFPRFAPGWGGVTDPRIELNENLLSSGASQRSVLLHEIQHAIQDKEGFAPGTNIQAQSAGRIKPAVKRYEEAVKNDPEMRELMSLRSSMDYKKQINEANDLHTAEYAPRYKEIDASSMSDPEKEAAYNALNREYNERIENMFPMVKKVGDLNKSVSSRNIPLYAPTPKMLTPTEAYHQYAGETEARNVQNRMNWSEENLRGIRPWETQEYSYMDQLFPENDVTWKLGYASGGEVNDDDIDDALRIAKDVGGATPQNDMQATYAALESANVPQSAAPVEPRYPDETAQQMAAKKAYIAEAMGGIRRDREPTDLEYWNAMPPEARAEFAAQYPELGEEMRLASEVDYYENAQRAKASQPYSTQSMTHDAPVPRREMKINMPLLGGEYSMGTAPYNVAEGLQGMAQGAYDFKTMPAYFFPPTAPFALAADVAESRLADDPVGLLANVMLTPAGGRLAKDISRPVVNKALLLTRGY